MTILNIFFQYLKKQKLKKLQMFLQIFISLACVLLLIGMILNINNKLTEIEELTSIDNIKGNFLIDNEYNSDPEIISNNLKNLTSDINKFNKIKFNQFSVQAGLGSGYDIYIDSNMNDSIKFPIIKGRNFDKNDFKLDYEDKETIIPIIISKNLEQKYPLNSEFKTKNNLFVNENNYINGGSTVKVVGILDNSAKFWLDDTILVDKLNFFDVIIYPLDFQKIPQIISQYFINLNCSKDEYNNIKKEIEAKYPGIKLKDSDLKALFFDKLEDKIIELIFISIFTIVLLITSLFGFISIIHSIILMREKELGVYYCLGASKKNILLFILMEIVIISLLAAFICYISIYKFKDYFMYNFEVLLNKNTFLISLVIISLYILISNLVVSITILKKEPVELIKN